MKKIKIAQIGMNHLSHFAQAFDRLKKNDDYFEMVGYALPYYDGAPCFEGCRRMTVEEVLNDPEIEAVSIETDEVHLTKFAQMAADHNKHIQMEKPGGCDHAEFEKLINTMKKTGKVFHTGYMYRYNPVVHDLLERIKQGELGEIFSVEAQMNCRHTAENRQWLKDFPGGMMFFLGCHLVDLILQIQGDPKEIIPLNCSTGIDGVTADDFGMAVFKYDNGVSFAKTCSEEIGGFARRRLVVCGSKGSVEICPLEMGPEDDLFTASVEYFNDAWQDTGVSKKVEHFDRYYEMMRAFGKMIRGEIENPYTLDYELKLHRMVMQACGVKLN